MEWFTVFWTTSGISYLLVLSEAQSTELPLCAAAPQPCAHEQTSRNVCYGDNATTSVELELSLGVIQQITVFNIIVSRQEQRLIQGLSKSPEFQGRNRWWVSHMITEAESKSGVLTVRIDVHDLQPEDEFEAHVEIHVRNQIMSTPPVIWFMVNEDNCSSMTNNTDDETDISTLLAEIMALLSQQEANLGRMIEEGCMTKEDWSDDIRPIRQQLNKTFADAYLQFYKYCADPILQRVASVTTAVLVLTILIIIISLLDRKNIKFLVQYTQNSAEGKHMCADNQRDKQINIDMIDHVTSKESGVQCPTDKMLMNCTNCDDTKS